MLRHVHERHHFEILAEHGLFEGRVFDSAKVLILTQNLGRVITGLFEQVKILHQVSDPERRNAMLARAQELTRTPQSKVFLGDPETVPMPPEDFQSLTGRAGRCIGEQQAKGLSASAPNPAPQLVKLTEPVAVGVLNRHHRGIGHVHADLDHRGGHQCIELTTSEPLHDVRLLRGVISLALPLVILFFLTGLRHTLARLLADRPHNDETANSVRYIWFTVIGFVLLIVGVDVSLIVESFSDISFR